MAIYMKFQGIDGTVTAQGYEKQIELTSMQFGVGRHVSMDTGNASNRLHGRPSISEITVSKSLDDASSGLMKEALSGDKGKDVEIHVVETSSKQLTEYVTYTLKDVLVSAYSVSTGGGVPSESISLSFAEIEVAVKPKDSKNASKGGAQRVGYNLRTGVPK